MVNGGGANSHCAQGAQGPREPREIQEDWRIGNLERTGLSTPLGQRVQEVTRIGPDGIFVASNGGLREFAIPQGQ
jgi:hypothetical protein